LYLKRLLDEGVLFFIAGLALQVQRFEGSRPQGLQWLWDFEAVVQWTIWSKVVIFAGENFMRHNIGWRSVALSDV
jgi:hypothetical protein